MRSLIFKLTALLLGVSAHGQNLVLNPSFETVNTALLQCSWYTTQNQFNTAISNWTVPTGGSTDIFNTALATTCYCSPYSTNTASPGQQAPRTGNGFVNITVYGNGGCSPYREYIQGQLSTPLVAGTTYEVEFYVSLADNMSVGVNNLGVKFSNAAVNVGSMCVYSATPDLNYTSPIIMDKTNWTQIIFCYTPTVSGQEYFMIGNFFSDAATTTAGAGGGTGNTIRYFVDDVRVEAVTSGTADPGTNGTAAVCNTDPTLNLFNQLGGTPQTGGTWSGPSALSGGYLGTFDPATAVPGVYTYTVGGGATQCVTSTPASATVTVTTVVTGDPTISPAGPFCLSNPSATLVAADPGGIWSGTGITNANNGTFDPAAAGPGTHTITYTLPGCGGSDTQSVTVIQDNNATVNPAGPYCNSGNAVTLNATDPGGTWSGTGITSVSGGIFDPSVAGVGTHTITYTIPGACGDVGSTNITVLQQADASVLPAGPFCSSDNSVTLNALQTGGTWSGTGITDPVSGIFDPSLAGPGTHSITYSITGQCGDVQNASIVVNPQLDATITTTGPLCQNNTVVALTAVDSNGVWSGNGITDPSGIFDPSVAGSGMHTISYMLGGVCGDSSTAAIQVYDLLHVVASPDVSICEGESISVSAIASGGDGNHTFLWTDLAGIPLGGGSVLTVAPATTTNYIVQLEDNCGTIPVFDTVTVTVTPMPGIAFSVDNNNGCVPLSVNFQNNSNPSGNSCMWYFGDGTTLASCGTVSHTYNQPGCYDIKLVASNNVCTDSLTQNSMVCVFAYAHAAFDFSPNKATVYNPLVQFTNFSSNADSYLWDFGDGIYSFDTDPIHIYENPADYQICLVAMNVENCNDTACSDLTIEDELAVFVPNAFSPNDDNVNDLFIPVMSGYDQSDYEFMVFDRWGNVLFATTSPGIGWDGRDESGMVKEDVYVWSLRVKKINSSDVEKYTGHVTLLK